MEPNTPIALPNRRPVYKWYLALSLITSINGVFAGILSFLNPKIFINLSLIEALPVLLWQFANIVFLIVFIKQKVEKAGIVMSALIVFDIPFTFILAILLDLSAVGILVSSIIPAIILIMSLRLLLKYSKKTLLISLALSTVVVLIGLFLGSVLGSVLETLKPANEKVMYGYANYEEYIQNRSVEIATVDERFISQVMSREGATNRADAAQGACDLGYSYKGKEDDATAIKRFNQAWLLDHNHPCVYASYGYHYALTEYNFEKSFEMYDKALSLSEEKDSWWILKDYGEVLDYCYALDNSRTDCLDKAFDNLTKSITIKDEPITHRMLAGVYYHKGEYAKAWDEVYIALDGGVTKAVMDGLVGDLKKEMSDPKGRY